MTSGDKNVKQADARTAEFLRLLSEHDARLSAFILALVPSWTDAQDIAQDVRIALWEQFDNYDRAKDFGVWCRTIAHYKIMAYRKRSTARHARLSNEFVEQVAAGMEAAPYEEEARHRALVGCLGKQSHDIRDLLLRYYSGQHSLRDLAQQAGKSYDALRQSVVRARLALKDCIDRTLREEAQER